jgi:PAS domain S-box-containing protein
MDFSHTQVQDSFLDQLRGIIEQAPSEQSGDSWKDYLVAYIRGSLESFSEQVGHDRALIVELKLENERLRSRLAGVRAVESSVSQRAEEFRSLAEHSPDGIIRLDADLQVLYVNPLVEFISGLPREDFIGRTFLDIFDYPQVEDHRRLLEKVIYLGVEERLEIEVPTSRGQRWFDLRIVPEINSGVKPETLLIVARDITHLKEIESARSRLEDRMRVATSRAGFIVFEHDRDLFYTWVHIPNSETGVDVAAILGKRDDLIYPTAVAEKLMQIKKQVLESGVGVRLDLEVPMGGKLCWFDSIFEPVYEPDGEVSGLVCSVIDITERRHLESDLIHQRVVLEKVFEANPGGMAVVCGTDFVVQMANAAYQAITPNPEMNPVGLPLSAIWKQADDIRILEAIGSVITQGASVTHENVVWQYQDGTKRSFTMHIRPLTWGDQPAALIVSWERTALDEALKEVNQRAAEAEEGRRTLEALMEYIPEGIVIASGSDLKMHYLSEYSAGLTGQRRSDMQGRLFREYTEIGKLFRADGVSPLTFEDHPLSRAAVHGEVVEGQEIILARDGEKMRLLCNAGPICDREGNILGSIVAMRDITDRERSEAHQRFLTDLGRALVALLSSQEMIECVITRMRRYLRLNQGFFSVGDEAAGANIIPAEGEMSLANPFQAPLAARLSVGRVAVIADASLDPLTANFYQEVYAPLGMRAFIAIPMMDRKGQWSGTLVAASDAPRVWRSDEVSLLNSAADLSRLAIENAHLFADLQNFRRRFEIALRNAPISVYTIDLTRRINWAFNAHYGVSSADLIGKTPHDLLVREDADALIALEDQVIATGETARQEMQVFFNGQKVSLDVTVEPLYNAEGHVTGLAVASLDITQQRRMEAEALLNLAHIEIQHRLIQERESERTRIARELHDGPLQDLIATNFTLVEAMDINEKEPRLSKMQEIQATLQRQIKELRRFCNELRPPVLGPFGLEKTIRSHAESFQERYPDLQIDLDLERDERKLPEDLRMNLYRVYQELLNNIARHAQAKHVEVRFIMEEEQALLEVRDDGIGFHSPQSWIDLARLGHLGLVGLRERVEMAGGQVEIDSRPGQGTRVKVIVPR